MPFITGDFCVQGSDGRNWLIIPPVPRYATQARGRLEELILPVGAATDGGSIPGICWSIPGFQPFGAGTWKGYVFHDAAYKGLFGLDWTRQQCDDLLLEVMLGLGEDYIHAYTIYTALRVGGQAAFNKDRSSAQPAPLSTDT